MNLKGVIFDLDGTLLDSMPVWDTLGEEYLIGKGYTPNSDLREKAKTMGLPEAAQHLQAEYGLVETADQIIQEIIHFMGDKYRYSIPLKESAQSFLDELKNRNVKMCIATAGERPLVEAALERLGISDYFCGILTCREAGAGKDKPDIYHQALELLGTDMNETVIFEDALHAVKTAKEAGFLVAGIYDKSAHGDSSEMESFADWYISSFDEWDI